MTTLVKIELTRQQYKALIVLVPEVRKYISRNWRRGNFDLIVDYTMIPDLECIVEEIYLRVAEAHNNAAKHLVLKNLYQKLYDAGHGKEL